MKVVIVAGGTGGHFYPGLAVAKRLASHDHKVRFFIRRGDFVRPLLDREGFQYRQIFGAGFVRRLHPQNIVAVLKFLLSFVECFFSLAFRRPDVILAMGGYLSVSPVLVGKLLGIPTVLHEQNVQPGLANRLLSLFADRIALSFEDSRRFGLSRGEVTGNPIRTELRDLPSKEAALTHWSLDPQALTLLIFGGSLGAHRLNELAVEAFHFSANLRGAWQVLHITGPNDQAEVGAAYNAAGESARLRLLPRHAERLRGRGFGALSRRRVDGS